MIRIEMLSEYAQRMLIDLHRKTSVDSLATVRNTLLGGAATATAILIALTQVGAKETSLLVAVVGSAIAAPIFLALAAVLEIYLHLGEPTFEHLSAMRVKGVYPRMQYLAGICLYVALSGIAYFLSPWALLGFVASTVGSIVAMFTAYARLIIWWAERSEK